ncbi:protein SIEVE ELEMENT OCCLUSION B-like [Prunus avium]|uniref:Protein SIEVE ELEMENT OCCLUSION B-like n=1 Tax=Prunus avium TaxID=42229 RepID=A0A6P5U3S6_PRUAV|nr:protein SIEVE ELEMENT OCCLUSION B-like [Prunus avium]
MTHEEHIWVDNVSEDQIWTVVHENHFPDQNKLSFSIQDLLSVTGNIIDDAANNSVVDNILQQNAPDMTNIYNGKDTFISPLCLLKSISCQREAVLTLAAFALEYGDFWHLAQHYGKLDKLTKSVAILKRVSILIKHEILEKRKAAVTELNNLIMETYHVIGYIFELEHLLQQNNPNDVPTLTTAIKKIPTAVYWTIYSIVACTAEINRLTSDKEEPDNLPKQLSLKINEIHKKLKEDYKRCMKEKAETIKYLWISKELVICENITKVISTLILYNDTEQPVVSRDSNNNKIDGDTFINEVKGKYLLLYISSLKNISKEELLRLTNLYKRIDQEYNCKIVWIPIEGDWTTEAKTKESQFMEWRKMMPWYAVQYFSSPSYMYLKKEWKVRGNSTVVLINPQGKVKNTNALPSIKDASINFFDFLDIKVHTMLKPVVAHITKEDTQLQQSMENKGYTFFIGGKNQKTTSELCNKIIKAKPAIEKELKIQIGLATVTAASETEKTFWAGMENLFFSLAHYSKEYEYEQVTKEVHKLLSYKLHKDDIDGWIMLTKGWTVVTCGQANTIFTTLEEFSFWKQHIIGKEWGHAFTKHHARLITGKKGLSCITFQIAGNAPMHLDCPVCDDPMETKLVKYNCCHPRLQNAAN